jgi:hypothetical protein
MRALVAAVAIVLSVGLIAGCNDDSDEPPPAPAALEGAEAAQTLAQAAEKTATNQETVTAVLDLSVSTSTTPEQTVQVVGEIDPEAEDGSFKITAGGSTLTATLVGEDAWLRLDTPGFAAALPEGVKSVEVDRDELAKLGLQTSFEPGGITPQLYLVLGAVEPVAEEEAGDIGGDPVRFYTFDIDKGRAVAAAPAEVRDAVRDAITISGDLKEVTGEASIDSEGRMRSFQASGSASPPTAGLGELKVKFKARYAGFGAEIDLRTPKEGTSVPLDQAPRAERALREQIAAFNE